MQQSKNPSEALLAKVEDKGRVLRTLDKQLFDITGIPPESHVCHHLFQNFKTLLYVLT